MTYRDLYEKAEWKLEKGEITSGEFDEMTKPLDEEIRPHGEWLSHYEYCKKHDCIPSGLIAFWWCNQCEQGVEIKTNFCPNCGTDMRPRILDQAVDGEGRDGNVKEGESE